MSIAGQQAFELFDFVAFEYLSEKDFEYFGVVDFSDLIQYGLGNNVEFFREGVEKHPSYPDAEFSHSICPKCAEKFYPDLKIYDD